MLSDDPAAACTECTGCGDIFLLLEHKHLTSNDSTHTDPIDEAEGDEHSYEVCTDGIEEHGEAAGMVGNVGADALLKSG